MLEKIRNLFSKENPNKTTNIVVVLIFAFTAFNFYTHFIKKKEKVKVSGEVSLTAPDVVSEVAKLKAEEERKKELEQKGVIVVSEEQKEEEKEEKPKEEKREDKNFYEDRELLRLKREIEALKREQEKQRTDELTQLVVSYLSSTVSYGKEEKNAVSRSQKGKVKEKTKEQNLMQDIYELSGEVEDTIRLRPSDSAFVRIKTEMGTILAVAYADEAGIRFKNSARLNGKRVSVQITDKEGSPYVFTYAIDETGKKVAKVAFLEFLKGVAEGIASLSGETLLVPTGSAFQTIHVAQNTTRYALSKGISEGISALVKEEGKKLQRLNVEFVLREGEEVKILLVGGGK